MDSEDLMIAYKLRVTADRRLEVPEHLIHYLDSSDQSWVACLELRGIRRKLEAIFNKATGVPAIE